MIIKNKMKVNKSANNKMMTIYKINGQENKQKY